MQKVSPTFGVLHIFFILEYAPIFHFLYTYLFNNTLTLQMPSAIFNLSGFYA